MLHTTALGLSQGTVAELAKNHLEEINSLIMELGLAIPRVVLKELSFEGYQLDTGAADRAVKNLRESWRNGSSAREGRRQLSDRREPEGQLLHPLRGTPRGGSPAGGWFLRGLADHADLELGPRTPR